MKTHLTPRATACDALVLVRVRLLLAGCQVRVDQDDGYEGFGLTHRATFAIDDRHFWWLNMWRLSEWKTRLQFWDGKYSAFLLYTLVCWASIAGHLLSENLSDRKFYAMSIFPHKALFFHDSFFFLQNVRPKYNRLEGLNCTKYHSCK